MVYYATMIVLTSAAALVVMKKFYMVGLLGACLSISVSGSPLAVIRTVLREKSTAAMPFWTSAITWLANISWIAYGLIIARDPIIWVPNIVGLVFSSTQMLLFLRYGISSKGAKEHGHSDDTIISGGLLTGYNHEHRV